MNKKDFDFHIETNSMLNIFFSQREDEIYQITNNERELLQKKAESYSKIYSAIDNIPNAFEETRKGIEHSVEIYIDTLSRIQANENEKFYKSGFSDAFKLFAECICENSSTKKNSNS